MATFDFERDPELVPGSIPFLRKLSRKLAGFYQDDLRPNMNKPKLLLSCRERQLLYTLVLKEVRRMMLNKEEQPVNLLDIKPDSIITPEGDMYE